MKRRIFLTGGAAVLTTTQLGSAQQKARLPRVGVLTYSTLPSTPRAEALLAGLREFGHVDGQTVTVEWRASGGRAERLPDLVSDLVRLNVQVIVAPDNPAIAAAQKATTTIPIVMVLASDPVGTGYVASLAQPGGNTTGLTSQATDLQAKSLQLLKEAIPSAKRVLVLWNPGEAGRQATAKEAEMAARSLGLQADLVGVRSPGELENFLAAVARQQPTAVLIQPSQIHFAHRLRIAELATKRFLPTMGWSADTAEAGWLMSYGPSITALYRRAGYYVDKVLKGTKPADLPIEQPTTFEFVVNLKTAKMLRLTIPPTVVTRADRVIE
jgi:putative ABC transport system substrate-binding protein